MNDYLLYIMFKIAIKATIFVLLLCLVVYLAYGAFWLLMVGGTVYGVYRLIKYFSSGNKVKNDNHGMQDIEVNEK